MHRTTHRTALKRIALLLMISFLLTSAIGSISALAYLSSASWDLMNEAAILKNSSYNQSDSIAISNNETLAQSLQNIPMGGGYYASHPILIGGGSGMRTVISDGNSAMSHEVLSAGDLSGSSEFSASSTAGRGALERVQSASMNMQIDESVTDGRVSIGVLSGEGSDVSKGFRAGPSSSAWKSPTIEIEEEYVGTYHISKNFSLSSSHSDIMQRPGWLNWCAAGCIISLAKPKPMSADDVFNCESQR
ncbi:MAG: hypothetical protein MUE87_01845 [Methanothrix sp.]|nr:hypothetical protein [Methanothrix sp.]